MKKILFVCIENSCRSQMAEGLAGYFGKDVLEPYSAGSRPSGKVNQYAIDAMKEIGIDISNQRSKSFDELTAGNFDYVIGLGCKDICPFFPAEKHVQWDIEDPKGKGMEDFRKIRDEIKEKIEKLIEEVKNDGKAF